MIDPTKEPLVLVAGPEPGIRGIYPRNPDGSLVSVDRVYRDIRQGRGGIYLECVYTPRLATSREAVARFFARLTEARTAAAPDAGHQSLAARERAKTKVEERLDRLGI
jgi:hypothetical protein